MTPDHQLGSYWDKELKCIFDQVQTKIPNAVHLSVTPLQFTILLDNNKHTVYPYDDPDGWRRECTVLRMGMSIHAASPIMNRPGQAALVLHPYSHDVSPPNIGPSVGAPALKKLILSTIPDWITWYKLLNIAVTVPQHVPIQYKDEIHPTHLVISIVPVFVSMFKNHTEHLITYLEEARDLMESRKL